MANTSSIGSSSPPARAIAASRPPRILILDDEIEHAQAFERALTEFQAEKQQIQFWIEITTNPDDIQRYIKDDTIDIYVVDLKLKTHPSSIEDKELGSEIVRKIHQSSSHAGVVVYSAEPIGVQLPESLGDGADDYIIKGTDPKIIRAKVEALWRRVQKIRPSLMSAFVHTNRIFEIGRWHFVVGSRELSDELGNRVRISPTEHAFLSYIVAMENHEIDREHFNAHVLGREIFLDDRRLDNLVSRLRSKLGDSLQIISIRNDGYKLLSIRELGK